MQFIIDGPFTGRDWQGSAFIQLIKLKEHGYDFPLRGGVSLGVRYYPSDKRKRSIMVVLECIFNVLRYAKIIESADQISQIDFFHQYPVGLFEPRIEISLS